MTADKRQPWMKWYHADWRSEPKLKLVSRAARSLWLDLLGLMHEAEPYGHLLIDGASPTVKDLAAIFGDKEKETSKLLAQLRKANVFSTTDDGVIFSRRMVRDRKRAEQDRDNGKSGGNPKLKAADNRGVNPPDKPTHNRVDNPPVNGGHKAQMPEAKNQKEKENPERPVAASPRAELMAKCWKAIGVPDGSTVPLPLVGELFDLVNSLETEGCDFDADIAPALRARPSGAEWPSSVEYWRKAARNKRNQREASIPPARPVEIGEWRGRLDVWNEHGKWAPTWGPKPGEVGCLVPPALQNGAAACSAH